MEILEQKLYEEYENKNYSNLAMYMLSACTYLITTIGSLLFDLKQDLNKIIDKYSQRAFKLMGYYIEKLEEEDEK